MEAELLLRERYDLSETEFVEIVVWKVDPPVRASAHAFKYRLAFVSNDACVVRYDNEAGKGDHKHADGHERPYQFVSVRRLLRDFWDDVVSWQEKY